MLLESGLVIAALVALANKLKNCTPGTGTTPGQPGPGPGSGTGPQWPNIDNHGHGIPGMTATATASTTDATPGTPDGHAAAEKALSTADKLGHMKWRPAAHPKAYEVAQARALLPASRDAVPGTVLQETSYPDMTVTQYRAARHGGKIAVEVWRYS